MKFSIRDLLWLMVVVALAAGWWSSHSQLTLARTQGEGVMQENRELQEQNLRSEKRCDELKETILEWKSAELPPTVPEELKRGPLITRVVALEQLNEIYLEQNNILTEQNRTLGPENRLLKKENAALKTRVWDLEKRLGLPHTEFPMP